MPKIKGGYVLQPRIFDNSGAAKMSPVTRELWFYLLRNVNHKDNGRFKRGQKFFQFSEIQEDLHWYVGYRKMVYSKPQLTKALRRLNEGNMTATVKATRGIVITICNYNIYQDPKNYEGNDEGSTKDQRKNFRGNTINKNDKNERKKEDKKTVESHVNFKPTAEKIYKNYVSEINPRSKTKQRAIKNIENWLKRGRTEKDLIFAYKKYSETMSNDNKYRKNPANFYGINEDFAFDFLPVNYQVEKKIPLFETKTETQEDIDEELRIKRL